jgi:hypothetical protein
VSDYDPLPYCALLSRATSPSLSSQNTAIALSFLPASNHLLANVPIQGLRLGESVLMSAEGDFTQSKARRNADTRRPQDSHRVLVRLFSTYPIDACS